MAISARGVERSAAATTTTSSERCATTISARPSAAAGRDRRRRRRLQACPLVRGLRHRRASRHRSAEDSSAATCSRRRTRWLPADCRRTSRRSRQLHAERGLVELDLVFAADLVGQLLPGRGDVVGAFLGRLLAGEDLGQLVLGDAVVLEDAGDARLDRRVRMVVGVELRVQVGGDDSPCRSRRPPTRRC